MYNETKQKAKIRLSRHFLTGESTVPLFTNMNLTAFSKSLWFYLLQQSHMEKYKTSSDPHLGDDGSVVKTKTDTEKNY